MAPEYPPALVIVDAELDGHLLRARVEYVQPKLPAASLRVRWNVESQPEDFRSVGAGVAYVYTKSIEIEVSTSEHAKADPLGNARYKWAEGLRKEWDWIMLVLILPENHTLVDPQPFPAGTKLFDGRLALYWMLTGNDLGRTGLELTLKGLERNLQSELIHINKRYLSSEASAPVQITVERAVFISYAHADNECENPKERWLDRFVQFVEPLVRQGDFTLCSDRDINVGQSWHKYIQAQLSEARAVVLFVSPAFLASDYIASGELPVILKNASEHGVKIFPILISPSMFEHVKYKYPDPKSGPREFTLSSIQSANPPSKTLIEMSEAEQNRVLKKVADQLVALLSAKPQ